MIVSVLPVASLQAYATELEEAAQEESLPAQSTETPQPDILMQEELIQATPMTTSSPAQSGTCGENITWTLDYAGTLIISGKGAMTGTGVGRSIWHDRRGDITKVVVQSGVTQIASYSFAGCYNLVDAIVEEGVTRIDSSAFSSCTSLKNVSLPSTLKYIGSDCFIYCRSLEEICIPDQITEIQLRTFSNCTSLISVTLPSNLGRIGKKAFMQCSQLPSIVFPEGLTEIGDYAFNGCNSLETVWIPLSLKKDGQASLATCPLKDIYYPGSSKQFRSIYFDRLVPDFRETATFHFGIPDLVPPIACLVNNAQTGLQELTWEPIEDAVSYEIYRAKNTNGPFTLVADTIETFWRDSDAALGKTYYYQVKAIHEDRDRSSALSQPVKVTHTCANPIISIVNDSKGKPKLSWSKVNSAKKYTVYRATSEDGKYSKLGTTSKLSYTDSKAKAGNTYYYKVIANGSKSTYNSPYSNIVSCGVICGTPTVTVKVDANTGKPTLSWKKVDGAAKYAIYRQLPGEETFTLMAEQTAVSYADKTAPIDTVCQYYVQALGKTADLNGAASKTVSATSGIARPDVKGSVDSVSGKPVLTWDAVEGAVKYEVYRSTKSNKSYKLIDTVETLTYTDETVSAGKTYYYQVKAVGQVSKSASSSYDKLTGKCAIPEISTTRDASTGKTKIVWKKVAGAKKYTVYRATTEDGKYSKLGTATKTYYTDSKSKSGVTYFYKVVANGSSSKYNSGYSLPQSGTAGCAAPKVTVKNDSVTGQPVLSWKKIDGATEYAIYRQLPNQEELMAIDIVEGASYTDTTAPLDATCKYAVVAVNYHQSDLSSGYSNIVTATVKFGKVQPACSTGIYSDDPTLLWEHVEGAVRYEVWRSNKKSNNMKYYTQLSADANGEDGFTDTTAVQGKTYYYKVVAIRENGQKSYSNYLKFKVQ